MSRYFLFHAPSGDRRPDFYAVTATRPGELLASVEAGSAEEGKRRIMAALRPIGVGTDHLATDDPALGTFEFLGQPQPIATRAPTEAERATCDAARRFSRGETKTGCAMAAAHFETLLRLRDATLATDVEIARAARRLAAGEPPSSPALDVGARALALRLAWLCFVYAPEWHDTSGEAASAALEAVAGGAAPLADLLEQLGALGDNCEVLHELLVGEDPVLVEELRSRPASPGGGDPARVESELVRAAREALRAGQQGRGEALLERALRDDPGDLEARFELGVAIVNRDPERALALAGAPTEYRADMLAGVALGKLGRLTEALDALSRAFAQAGTRDRRSKVHQQRTLALAAAGEAAARRAALRCAGLLPVSAAADRLIAGARRLTGDPLGAHVVYDRLLASRDASALDAGGRALARLGLGDRQGALEDAERYCTAQRGKPLEECALQLRAVVRLALDDPRGALRDAGAALRIDPLFPHAIGVRARAAAQLGEHEDALTDLRAMLAGDLFRRRRDEIDRDLHPFRSEADVREALARSSDAFLPGSGSAHQAIRAARALSGGGRFVEALQALKALLEAPEGLPLETRDEARALAGAILRTSPRDDESVAGMRREIASLL